MLRSPIDSLSLKAVSAAIWRALQTPLVITFVLMGNLVMFLGAIGFYYLESGTNPHVHSFFDALWWSVSTITTVGFGDVTPITFWGRLVGIVMMLVGVTFFVSSSALLVSIIHSTWLEGLLKAEQEQEEEVEKLEDQVKSLRKDVQRILEILEKRAP